MARYTSAAPMFFKEMDNYVDGGVLANNPCDFGLTAIQNYYRALGEQLAIALVVSIGTGIFPGEEIGKIDAQEFLFFGKHWFNWTDTLKKRAKSLMSLLSNAVSAAESCTKQYISFTSRVCICMCFTFVCVPVDVCMCAHKYHVCNDYIMSYM